MLELEVWSFFRHGRAAASFSRVRRRTLDCNFPDGGAAVRARLVGSPHAVKLLERSICWAISALLLINYAGYLVVSRHFGVAGWQKVLPLQLCDWAMFVIIVALWTGNRRWLEVAYFWGIGGTLQAILTPNLAFGFPDLRFVSFFVAHSGIIVGIVFLMLVYGFRPTGFGILRTFAWTEVYFVIAFTADLLTGENYGYLLHKPEAFSLLSYLSDWRPLYLLQFHVLAWVFFCVLYLPFAIVDLIKGNESSVAPS
jgi:hypothetical integral membrane protein (TIGR02206 family)